MNGCLENSISGLDVSNSHESILPTERFNDAAQRPGGGSHSMFVQDDNVSTGQVVTRFVPLRILPNARQIVSGPSPPEMPH